MNGTIITLEDGALAFENVSTDYNRPQLIRHVWPIVDARTSGYRYAAVADAIGRGATIRDGRVHCYLGEGASMDGRLPELGQTKAIILEITEAPKPRVRAGTETRWRSGQWEKLTAKGWKAA